MNTRKRWLVVALFGLVTGFLAACEDTATTTEPPVGVSVFEDFSASSLDGSRWTVPSSERKIVANQLRLSAASTGMVGPNSYFNRISTASPSAGGPTITEWQADVTVLSASVSGTGAQARASVELRYQNPAYFGSAQSSLGVRVELRQQATGLVPRGYLYTCADADCTTGYQVGSTTGVNASVFPAVSVGTAYTLKISLDPATRIFTLSINGTTATLNASGFGYFDPADFAQARLIAQTRQDAGTTGGSASMSAAFDNVMANSGSGLVSYDTFDGVARIDPAKWVEGESSALISGGVLQMTQFQAERTANNNIPLYSAAPVRSLTADVTVTGASATGAGVTPEARLAGTFFHTGGTGELGDLGGGYNGDVWAQVYLTGTDALWAVVRCDNRSTCTSNTIIDSGQLNLVNLTLGVTYTLSIEWDGTLLHFKAGDLPEKTWNPVTDGGLTVLNANPAHPFLTIGTRIGGTVGAGETGSIEASFDNVQVANRTSTAGAITNVLWDAFEGLSPLPDQHRWNGCQFTTEIAPGATPTPSGTNELELGMQCGNLEAGQSYTHYSIARNSATPTKMQATISVPSNAVVSAGGQLRVFIELSYQPAQYVGWSDLYDAGARVELRDLGDGNGLTGRGLIYLCTNSNCSTVTATSTPTTGGFTPNVPLSYNTPYTVSVEYDAGNSQFIMTLSDGITTLTGNFATSTLGSNFDPTFENSQLAVRTIAGTADGYAGDVVAHFDDVQFDYGAGLVAHDNFDGGPNVDTSKWNLGDAYRTTLGDGVLTVHQRQSDRQTSVSASVDHADVVGMWADTSLLLYTVTGGDGTSDPIPAARLSGYFYNDGSVGDGNGGRNGNIIGLIDLRDNAVRYGIARCVNAACVDGESIANGVVTSGTFYNVASPTTHRIGMLWDGAKFRFYLDSNAPVIVDPSTLGAPIVGPAVEGGMSLGTRVQSKDPTPGAVVVGVGEVTATFDNVVVAYKR